MFQIVQISKYIKKKVKYGLNIKLLTQITTMWFAKSFKTVFIFLFWICHSITH